MRIGDQGLNVTRLQSDLAALGYKLKGTGYFGPATDAAVTDFQRRVGLDPDGVAGSFTLAALAEHTARDFVGEKFEDAVSEPLWVVYGKSLLNVREGKGANENLDILRWAKEEGGSVAKTYKSDAIPWCALFVNHLFTKAGLRGTETLWALDWAVGSTKWPHVKLDGPVVGAVAAMKRTGGGHVIVVVGRDQHGNIMGLGGNQADEVSIRPFPRARLNQGYGWPKDISIPVGVDRLPVVKSDGKLSTREA